MNDYKKGQIDMFNRIYTASVDKTDDILEGAFLIIKELNIIREELVDGEVNEAGEKE